SFRDSNVIIYFFFQAEDGIRDRNVTGVQTCALPISAVLGHPFLDEVVRGRGTHQQWRERSAAALVEAGGTPQSAASALRTWLARSEERRVGGGRISRVARGE